MTALAVTSSSTSTTNRQVWDGGSRLTEPLWLALTTSVN